MTDFSLDIVRSADGNYQGYQLKGADLLEHRMGEVAKVMRENPDAAHSILKMLICDYPQAMLGEQRGQWIEALRDVSGVKFHDTLHEVLSKVVLERPDLKQQANDTLHAAGVMDRDFTMNTANPLSPDWSDILRSFGGENILQGLNGVLLASNDASPFTPSLVPDVREQEQVSALS